MIGKLFSRFRANEPEFRVKLLIVCRANITRSPFLEGLLRKRIQDRYPEVADEIGLSSAGVNGFHRAAADPVIRFLAQSFDVDLLPHASKPLRANHVSEADYIFTLEESFADHIRARFRESEGKVFPLPMFGNSDVEREEWDVSDPTGKEAEAYAAFVEIADAEADRILTILEGQILGARTNVVFIGLPGAGKTTVGKILAERSGWELVDTDRILEAELKTDLQTYVDREGYLALREKEAEVIQKLECEHSIISTGGSAVYSTEAMTHLKNIGRMVWLTADHQTILERLGSGEGRGLAKPETQSISELLEERERLCSRWAEKEISTDLPVEETVETIGSLEDPDGII